MSLLPWIQKYAPKSSIEIPQTAAITQLKAFVSNYKSQKKKAALIYGPAGSCKTSAVHAIAKELGWEIIEVNSSDFRNSDQINERLGNAIKQKSLFFPGKIILMDEVDGVSGMQDRGGISALTSLIEQSVFPIVMTANDPWDKKFSSLRSKSLMIAFGTINYLSISNVLKAICEKENIQYEEVNLKTLARRVSGDLRAAINDLQSLTVKKELTKESIDTLGDRNKEESMMNALVKVFKNSDPIIALSAFDNVPEDFDKQILWIEENLPKEYSGESLYNAFNALSKADVFRGRIRRQQHWRFLVYINALITAGVSVSKKQKNNSFIKYSPTTRILKIWQANMKYSSRKSIVEKIAEKTHSSKKKVLRYTIPFIKDACKNEDFIKKLVDDLELDEDEIKWINS